MLCFWDKQDGPIADAHNWIIDTPQKVVDYWSYPRPFYAAKTHTHHYFLPIFFPEFAGSATQLVADVDCTADGKSLCDSVGVRGYPTIKWGDPSDLQDYQGGRDFDALKKFADENLKPMCSPKNIDLCDDEKKAQISKYQAMSDDDLAAAIAAEEKKLEDAEAEFKAEVQKLQEKYSSLSTEKDEKIAAVKNAGLGLMKAVKSTKPAAGSDEL